MRIAFDISQTGNGKAGCGYFAHSIIQSLLDGQGLDGQGPDSPGGDSYVLLPSFGDFYLDPEMPTRNPYPNRMATYGPRFSQKTQARHFWEAPNLEEALGAPDVIHSNNFWCPTQIRRSRLIYTFYDLGFVENPGWTTEANRVGCFSGVYRASIAADWVVAISQASRDHYLRTFPHFPEDRIKVIYPCSRFTNAGQAGARPTALADLGSGEFWLNVGTIEPRKNQHTLVEAYARYAARVASPKPLILAGGKGWLMDGFQQHLEKLGIAQHVRAIGYVSDEELIWLYRNCHANLYPSFFEGFGLPVLEGMQFGAPCVVSNSSSLPEVAGDAAILIDPLDLDGWANAMTLLDTDSDRRNALAQASIRQAGTFDWRASAGALRSLYEQAVALPKRAA